MPSPVLPLEESSQNLVSRSTSWRRFGVDGFGFKEALSISLPLEALNGRADVTRRILEMRGGVSTTPLSAVVSCSGILSDDVARKQDVWETL